MLIGRGRPAGRDEKEAICSREEGKGGVAQGSSLIEKALMPVSLLLQLSVDGGRGIRKRSEERAINIQAAEDKTRTGLISIWSSVTSMKWVLYSFVCTSI